MGVSEGHAWPRLDVGKPDKPMKLSVQTANLPRFKLLKKLIFVLSAVPVRAFLLLCGRPAWVLQSLLLKSPIVSVALQQTDWFWFGTHFSTQSFVKLLLADCLRK
jgi:hypothetical protein